MFYKTKSLDEALDIVRGRFHPLGEAELVPTVEARGRVLATAVRSPIDLPGFPRATMDGYAVRGQDTFGASEGTPCKLRLAGEVRIGQPPDLYPSLASGEARAIPTGGALPPGADAVVPVEDTELSDSKEVLIFSPVAPGANVMAPDEDLRAGQEIFEGGHRLRPQDIGALLGVGITQVNVVRRVRVGIISTGEELVPPEEEPGPGRIRDINSYTLKAQLEEAGAVPKLYGIVPDEAGALLARTRDALAENDLVLLSGGSSVGTRDLTLTVLSELGEVLVHGLRIKPGKPTILGISNGKAIVGLPGNPVSAMVVCDKLVIPILQLLLGERERPRRPIALAEMARHVPSAKGRLDFVRVRLVSREGRLLAEPILAQSGAISSLAGADGLVTIPAESEGLERGERVAVELW